MSIRTTNLNLLPILRALLKAGSVSKAAAELHLTQPATSNALNRLRALLGDPLLVRVGKQMRLSPKARRLLPLLDEACQKIDAFLYETPFDPALTRRSFVIEAPDYIDLLLGGPLIAVLGESAPMANVSFTYAEGAFGDKLASGAVDIAIVAWDNRVARGFAHMHGYCDRMVGLVRRDHPLAKRRPRNAAEIRAYPQIGFEQRFRSRGARTSIDRAMRVLTGHQRLGAQSFLLLPLLAAESDCVAIVPKALAERVHAMAQIATFELPGDPIIVDAGMLWSPIYETDPAHRWFRTLVDRLLRKCFDGADAPRMRKT